MSDSPDSSSKASHWPLSILGGFVSLFNLFLPLVLVRILSQADIGNYKAYFLYLAMIPPLFLTSGLMNGLSHWGGHLKSREQAFQVTWAFLLCLATAFILLGTLFFPALQRGLGWTPTQTQLFLLGGGLSILAGFFENVSIASHKVWRGALFGSAFDLIRNSSMLVAAVTFRTVQAVFFAHVVVMALKLALGWLLGYREGFQSPRLPWGTARKVLQYAIPVSVASALSMITSYSDQVLVSGLLPAEDFAVYSLGCLLIPPLLIFEQSVNRVMIPALSRAFAEGDTDLALRHFRSGSSELAWILFPAAFGLVVFADPIVRLLFTERYMSAVLVLQIFSLKHFANAIPYDAIARARGHGTWILRLLATYSVVALALVATLTSLYGTIGALVATILVAFSMRIHALIQVCRQEKWRIGAVLPLQDWMKYGALCVSGSGAALVARSFMGNTLEWFLAGGTIFVSIYFIGTSDRIRNIKLK
jgi:O-antigen/teichoic acid export membrane protein